MNAQQIRKWLARPHQQRAALLFHDKLIAMRDNRLPQANCSPQTTPTPK